VTWFGGAPLLFRDILRCRVQPFQNLRFNTLGAYAPLPGAGPDWNLFRLQPV
jgi:hypothetical protein